MSIKKEVSFVTLYESYRPLIESMSKKMLSVYSLSPSEYDDLVQEASIALFTAASVFDEKKGVAFGLYAKICIKNRLVSYINSRYGKMFSFSDISFEDIASEESHDITPEQFVINKESLENMRSKIDETLTPFENSVFWLYLVGIPYSDIANALCKPTKSIDNAIHRIKVKLRKLYTFY